MKMTIISFSKEEVGKIANKPGIYAFFNRNRTMIYVGTSEVLRHRLQSYYQQDDFSAHPTKEKFRQKIAYFYAEYMPLHQARQLEGEIRCNLEYNFK
jgi:excinuclease UvrABC nuclease subunit